MSTFLDKYNKYNYGKNYVIKSKQKDKIMLQNIAVWLKLCYNADESKNRGGIHASA